MGRRAQLGSGHSLAGCVQGASRKPRLLVVITLAEAGGAQTSVSLLLPGLTRQFDVTVAAHGSGPLREAAEAAGVPFVELEHVRRSINPLRDMFGLVELVRLCRRIRPDVIHAHSSKAGLLGRLAGAFAGVPVRIVTVHGWSFAAYGGLPAWCFRQAERLAQHFTTAVICVADSTREQGLAARACAAGRTVVIHNAIDVPSFVARVRADGPPRIVSVARFAYPKDYGTLAAALGRVQPDFRAILVGDGPERPEVAAALQRAGLASRVEILGDRRDVPALLAESDIFVLSSRSEGFPISILEAMAAALPVVATNVGGVAEAVAHEETGLLVPAADPAALAEALELLIEDPELRGRLGTAAWARARGRFNLPRFHAAHLELYRRELEQFRPAEPTRRRRLRPLSSALQNTRRIG
jgi:glycosyltransferase involved in cell wall biosynthesis